MKRLLVCLLLLCLLTPLARAEDVPVWPEARLLQSHVDWGKTRFVYPHPEEFTPETGKVGFAGDVWCYGYMAVPSPWEGHPDTWSLLVRYDKDNGGERIAWLTGVKSGEVEGQNLPELPLAAGEYIDLTGLAVTDDPYGKQTSLGTMTGAGRVVAYLDDGWAAVSGPCDLANGKGEWPVLAFVARSAVDAFRRADLYLPHLEAVDLVSATPLHLPDDASDILSVHALPDGTFLIAYHCEGSTKLWLRVINWEGKKLFGKSVTEGYMSRIAVTEEGFICDCFDDESLSSGKRYTYRCQGRKLTAGKITGDETASAQDIADAPADLPVPEGCRASVFGALADGTTLLALNTGASGLLCAVTPDGTLHHLADMGQEVEWVSGVGSYGVFFTIDREAGAYRLCSWIIAENE